MITFKSQSEQWLAEQENRKLRPASLSAYRSILRTHLWPRFENRSLDELAGQNNRVLRTLVEDLRAKYSPASIQLILGVAKQVFESERNDNGLPVRSLAWATDFINAPAVVPNEQKAPIVSSEEVQAACADRKDGVLYLLLAASGLRISEALGLRCEDVEGDGTAVHVRRSKTPIGVRTVDLDPAVAETMAKLAGDTKPGTRIFPYSSTVFRRRQLVPGFHSLRRFRESVLQRSECRSILINAWMGHADQQMSTRYGRQLLEDKEYRRIWAARVGLGFTVVTQPCHGVEPGVEQQIVDHGAHLVPTT